MGEQGCQSAPIHSRSIPEGMTVAQLALDARRELVRTLPTNRYGYGTTKQCLGTAKAAGDPGVEPVPVRHRIRNDQPPPA